MSAIGKNAEAPTKHGSDRARSARKHSRADGGGALVEPSFEQRLMEGVTSEHSVPSPTSATTARGNTGATPSKRIRKRKPLRKTRKQVGTATSADAFDADTDQGGQRSRGG
jgi:hypothetical protein